jgi:hypothetical protein
MILSGVASTNSSSYNYNFGHTNHHGESVMCEVPKTIVDKCKAIEIERSIGPVYEYNEWVRTKDMVTGAGYLAYVLPGIAAYWYFSNERDKAINKSRQLQTDAERECEALMERLPASN